MVKNIAQKDGNKISKVDQKDVIKSILANFRFTILIHFNLRVQMM